VLAVFYSNIIDLPVWAYGIIVYGIGFIVIVPIATALFSFVSAGILYIIWKLLVPRNRLKPLSARCYAAAFPLDHLLGIILIWVQC